MVELLPQRLLVRAERPAAADAIWARAVLEGRGERIDVGAVSVRSCGSELAVTVRDGGAEQQLWDLADRLRAGGAEPGRGTPSPGTVPSRGEYTEAARLERLRWLRAHTPAPLDALGTTRLDPRALTGNIENLVGSIEVPVGLAGPLLFDGAHARGHVVAPLATTEGALVASVSRGASALTRAGGVRTRLLSQRMSRAPVWEFDDLHAAARFTRWIADHLGEIRAEAALPSRHAVLVELEPWHIGRRVYVRFVYETADAAGQNMTTACTWRASQWINDRVALVPGLDVRYSAIEGNASGDKKATYLNFLGARGSRVTAECVLDRQTLRDVLKTTPEEMLQGHRIGVVAGLQTGMLGYSINAANIVAALMLATGQDVACIHESGSAVFDVEADGDGLRASMLLPGVVVGSVGGGTGLPAQREALEVLGCAGEGGAARLAEIICGFALALDLSTQAAVCAGQFARAHERLGRNRPARRLERADLDARFFTPMLAGALGDPGLDVTAVEPIDCATGSSIVTELTARSAGGKLLGVLPLRLAHTGRDGAGTTDVVVKSKPLDAEVVLESVKIASLCGGDLATAYDRWRHHMGFDGCHTRELALYRSGGRELERLLPRLYGLYEDAGREAYVIVMEHLDGGVILKDSADDPGAWWPKRVDAALRGIAGVHAAWLDREGELAAKGWLGDVRSAATMIDMCDLWGALVAHNAREHPGCVDRSSARLLHRWIASSGDWWHELESLPRTLVHNDFNPRNIALRRATGALVAYDWELATIGVPQRDLVELLAFVLAPDAEPAAVERHVEVHRRAVAAAGGADIPREQWWRGYTLALRDFALTRLQLYLMAHTQREYPFVPRVAATTMRLIALDRERRACAPTAA